MDLYNPVSASQINEIIDARLNEMASTIDVSERGSKGLAIDIVKAGSGPDWMGQLRQLTDTELNRAAHRQSDVRISTYDAIALNRASVILLTLTSLLFLYVFIRQLRLQGGERAATEAKLEAAIEKRTLQLRELTKHLQTVREEEKDHLARELHDQLGALLTVA